MNQPDPPTGPVLIYHLTKISLARMRNRLSGPVGRTARKPGLWPRINRSPVWVVGLLLALSALVAPLWLTYINALAGDVYGGTQKAVRGLAEWPSAAGEAPVLGALALLILFTLPAVTTLNICMNQLDLGKATWDLEWLFTLPLSGRTIFLSKIFQYSLNNLAYFAYGGLFLAVFAAAGWGWFSFVLTVPAVACMANLVAAATLVSETFLRTRLPLHRLKNLQAVALLFSPIVLLAGFISAILIGPPEFMLRMRPMASAWLLFVPPVAPLALANNILVIPALVAMVCWSLALTSAAAWIAAALTHKGLVVGTSAYKGSRARATRRERIERKQSGLWDGILGKEMRLLWRDKPYLIQSIGFPLLMSLSMAGVFQMAMFAETGDWGIPMAAFGVAAYAVFWGTARVLFSEKKALWLLYTFPAPIQRIVLEKTAAWSIVGIAYCIALMALGFWFKGAFGIRSFANACIAVIGVAIFAPMASALSAAKTDPATSSREKMPTPALLSIGLIFGFAATFASPGIWDKAVSLLLWSVLAFAIWRQSSDRLVNLLDPTGEQPPRLGLMGALITMFVFTQMQGVLAAAFSGMSVPSAALSVSYIVSALTVGYVSLVIFRYRIGPEFAVKIGIVPKRRDLISGFEAVISGIKWGALAALFGLAYIAMIHRIPALRSLSEEMFSIGRGGTTGHLVLVALAVLVVAPVFEEYVMRGLVFSRLRLSLSLRPALLVSAALFAALHPPISVAPVFLLGVCAAISYERTGHLGAAITAHLLYNFAAYAANVYLYA